MKRKPGAVVSYIGLGGNLDQPVEGVSQALRELAELEDSQLLRSSSLYRSAPLGPTQQPDYINAVAVYPQYRGRGIARQLEC